MPSARREFTDAQRAQIFVRDRALCVYSGASLWLADHGAAPSSVDWVDHLEPAAKGGGATVENGVCSSYHFNWSRRDRAPGVRLFEAGRPTADYYVLFGTLRAETAEHLNRFSRLHLSDWYFNRGLFQVRKAAAGRSAVRSDGERFSRGVDYYARAAIRYFDKWRRLAVDVPSLRKRKLLPLRPSEDQALLIGAAEITSITAMRRQIKDFESWLIPTWDACTLVATVQDPEDQRELAREVRLHPNVPARVKRMVLWNLTCLRGPE